MTDRTALGLGTELDPEHITIAHHAKVRYLDRRGGKYPTIKQLDFAEGRLRDLLTRCDGQRPPVTVKNGRASRLFRSGGFRSGGVGKPRHPHHDVEGGVIDACSLCDKPLTTPVPYFGHPSLLLAQMGTKRWHYGCVFDLGRSLR